MRRQKGRAGGLWLPGSFRMRSARTLVFGYPPSGGLAAISSVPPVPPPPGLTFYVDPAGSASNDGSILNPWDLQTALNQPSVVLPGATIYLRGGTYAGAFNSALVGTAANPIIVRQYPGERAIINNRLTIQGADAWFWGFEVTDTAPAGKDIAGVYHHGPRTRLINLVVHDTSASGIISNPLSPDGEITGCIVYNCGTHFNQDHGLYVSNSSGTKLLQDNIVFNNEKYGLHLYGEAFHEHLLSNIVFGNGTISTPVPISAGLIIGSNTADGTNFQLLNNSFYDAHTANWCAQLGAGAPGTGDLTCTGNIFTGYIDGWPWVSALVSGNTFYSLGNVLGVTPPFGSYTWTNNAHYRDSTAAAWSATGSTYNNYGTFAAWKAATGLGGSDTNPGVTPTGTTVRVRANAYEAGRANIAIYNWDGLPTVSVDLSGVLTIGQAFVIKNAQDFFGTPPVTGTYTGALVAVPMAGIAGPVPVGRTYTTPPVTGPTFQAFVVQLQGA